MRFWVLRYFVFPSHLRNALLPFTPLIVVKGILMKQIFLFLVIVMLSTNASAEWVRIGENSRSIAYADTSIRRSGDTAVVWVLFDYKSIQESPRSGRRYLSEKAQHEIACKLERDRVLFFTWHADQMGNGAVVYTGKKPTDWEPTSSPGSYGKAFWKFACGKK